jgi:iron complex outermembrane receptor protein
MCPENKTWMPDCTQKTLDFIQSGTLGETLSKIPGIQNSYYGPNSGAPVIRSLSGNR